MTDNKKQVLAQFLEVDASELNRSSYDENIYNYGNAEYLVLTDSEADEKTAEEIKNSLWAFNADFIIQHCKNYDTMDCDEYNAAIEGLQEAQKNQCESLNGLVYALINDIDEFVNDAIIADGRGHFISYYDGKENELNNLYIYRLN